MPQSTWAAIVARVIERMKTVPGVGRVHEGDRLIKEAAQMEALALVDVDGERRFRMWTVNLASGPADWEDSGGTVRWDRAIRIRGYLQFEDGSAATPIALAEAIQRTLDTDIRTTKLNGTVLFGGPCELRANEPRMFGPMLCHYIEIACPVTTLESP